MKSWDEGPEPLLNPSNPKGVPSTRLWRSVLFLAAALVFGGAATLLYLRSGGLALTATLQLTAAETQTQALRCQRGRDFVCAEARWREYARLRPDEDRVLVHLGIVLNKQGKHAEALDQFEKALSMGVGSYELFAVYADSLADVGRADDAIEWSYKALLVAPRLLDVRSNLAKLLVAQGRHYEALSLLQVYDTERESRGQPGYFLAQRIAIESSLDAATARSESPEGQALRLPAHDKHFFVPVTLGGGRPTAYMVDTGASRTTLSEEALLASKVPYKVVHPRVQAMMANGEKMQARAVVIASMKLGAFELKNVSALACKGCSLLLGQSTLSHFDMRSSKVQGVEFLTLTPRR